MPEEQSLWRQNDGPAGSAFAVLNRAPGWYLNLKSQPRTTVQVKAVRQPVIAKVAEPEERGRLWAQLLQISPGYGEYQKRLTREFPMVILQPLGPSQDHD